MTFKRMSEQQRKQTRVLVCDDHIVVRKGLNDLLTLQGFEVVGEATDGRQAVEKAMDLDPEVVLMDLSMPRLGGVDAADELLSRRPSLKVVIVTHGEGPVMIEQAIRAIRLNKAQGLLLKDAGGDELERAIGTVMNGGTYISESALASVQRQVGRPGERREDIARVSQDALGSPADLALSDDEMTILSLLRRGEGDEAIAAHLYTSLSTAKRKVLRLREKFGDASNRTELVRRAAELGLPPGGEQNN